MRDAVELCHQLRIERCAHAFVEQGNPILFMGLFMHHANRVRAFPWPVVSDLKRGKDVDLALQPLPADQGGGRK
jgi:hypothetical protein